MLPEMRPRIRGLSVFNYNHIYLALLTGYGLGVAILGMISAMLGANFIFFVLSMLAFYGMVMVLKDFFEFLKREEQKYTKR